MAAASAAQARPALGPRRARALQLAPTVGLALAVLTVYLVEASLRKTPWVFSDELEWTQLSRAIAATGHAARRGQPIFFKSLYAYLIAPAWWIHSTSAAYGAIKVLNAIVMCAAALPAYLLARMLLARRLAAAVAVGSVLIPAMAFASAIVPESLAYLWFTLSAWLGVRALAMPRTQTLTAAAAAAALGPLVTKEFVVLPAALVGAAALLWVASALRRGAGVRGLRRGLGALAALALFAYAFNWLVVERVQRWTLTQYVNRHTLAAGGLAAGALAIGLGMLPVIGGLSSLALRERRGEPAYRAFAAYLAVTVLLLFAYTAAKVTFLARGTTLIEERNLFYAAPLLLCGTALCFGAGRLDWRAVAAASALVLWSAWPWQLQETGAAYFEAPGVSIVILANRSFIWTVQDIRILLCVVTAISLLLLAARRFRLASLTALVLVGAWMATGEIYATITNLDEADGFAASLPANPSWVDAATGGAGVTYLGEAIANPNPLWLTEFWNRSVNRVAALDGTAPGPGPAFAPRLEDAEGLLGDYTGDPYTLVAGDITLCAPLVERVGGAALYRTPHDWRLQTSETGVYPDGWMSKDAYYADYAPGGAAVLEVDLSRTAYNAEGPPGHAVVRVGSVRVDRQGEPGIARLLALRAVAVPDGRLVRLRIPIAQSPVTVWVHMTGLAHNPPDPRPLGAQVSFTVSRAASAR